MKKTSNTGKRQGLRMKALVEATGIPKSTILHYLHQGLLPKPFKTSPNMAYYDRACVDRLRFIRHAQRHHRRSLDEIREMLEAKGEDADFAVHLELHDLIFSAPDEGEMLDREEFLEKTGLTGAELQRLLESRLLLPLEADRFDSQDVTMGKQLAEGLARGVQAADLTYYVELGEKIVDREMDLRDRMTRHLPYDEDARRTLEMVGSARISRAYVIERLFQHRVAAMADLKQQGEPKDE